MIIKMNVIIIVYCCTIHTLSQAFYPHKFRQIPFHKVCTVQQYTIELSKIFSKKLIYSSYGPK